MGSLTTVASLRHRLEGVTGLPCNRAVGWAAAEPAPSLTIAMKCASHSGREIRASRHMHCVVQGV